MRRALWIAAAGLAVTAAVGAATGSSATITVSSATATASHAQDVQPFDPARADALAARVEGLPSDSVDEDRRMIFEAFTSFIECMDAFDGPRALRLARGMHAHADAVWSLFCLEGALRRAAPSDTAWGRGQSRAFEEADSAIDALLLRSDLTAADRIAIVQRRAILAAGFGRTAVERASLGRALASGGIDGAQISGLAALTRGDAEVAARLFGSLLDANHPHDLIAWPLRGHGIACLELLRGPQID